MIFVICALTCLAFAKARLSVLLVVPQEGNSTAVESVLQREAET
jgi:hypothetical protein